MMVDALTLLASRGFRMPLITRSSDAAPALPVVPAAAPVKRQEKR